MPRLIRTGLLVHNLNDNNVFMKNYKNGYEINIDSRCVSLNLEILFIIIHGVTKC